MARKPRIHFPSAVYHVIIRGNGGQDIFFSRKDRSYLYTLIQEGIERFGHRIHAFCLMTNHLHLIVQVGNIPLAKIIQNISFRYTRYINKRKKRVGHLFQGRYKALLIDVDNYLLELVRYIHNNPLRAGMVQSPDDYQWSSHRVYLKKEKIPWLTQELLLSNFAKDEQQARRLFHEFCLKGTKEQRRQEFHQGISEGRILGDDDFSETVLIKAGENSHLTVDVESLVRIVCEAYQISEKNVVAPGKHQPGAEARAVIAYLAQESRNPSLTDLGRYLGRDITTLSRSASRLYERLKNDQDLSSKLRRIKTTLKNA